MAAVNRLVPNKDEQPSRDRAARLVAGPDVAPTRHRSVGPINIMQRCYRTQIRQSTVDIGYSEKISGREQTEDDGDVRPGAVVGRARRPGRRRAGSDDVGDVTRSGAGRGRWRVVPLVLGAILGDDEVTSRGHREAATGR
jgi:hypothetical protein